MVLNKTLYDKTIIDESLLLRQKIIEERIDIKEVTDKLKEIDYVVNSMGLNLNTYLIDLTHFKEKLEAAIIKEKTGVSWRENPFRLILESNEDFIKHNKDILDLNLRQLNDKIKGFIKFKKKLDGVSVDMLQGIKRLKKK